MSSLIISKFVLLEVKILEEVTGAGIYVMLNLKASSRSLLNELFSCDSSTKSISNIFFVYSF